MKIDTGGSAETVVMQTTMPSGQGGVITDLKQKIIPGKTWLDECAMRAMQSILSKQLSFDSYDEVVRWRQEMVVTAYLIAQLMLAEKRRLESNE